MFCERKTKWSSISKESGEAEDFNNSWFVSQLTHKFTNHPTKKKTNKQNKTKQNKTKQNKTKQNKTKQNKTKQNKTKQNKTIDLDRIVSQYIQGSSSAKFPDFIRASKINNDDFESLAAPSQSVVDEVCFCFCFCFCFLFFVFFLK